MENNKITFEFNYKPNTFDRIEFPDICIFCEKPERYIKLMLYFPLPIVQSDMSKTQMVIAGVSAIAGFGFGGLIGAIGSYQSVSRIGNDKEIKVQLSTRACKDCLIKLSKISKAGLSIDELKIIFQMKLSANSLTIESTSPDLIKELSITNPRCISKESSILIADFKVKYDKIFMQSEDSIICSYCNNNIADFTCKAEYVFKKRLPNNPDLLTLYASFPRCQHCKIIHEKQFRKNLGVGSIGAFLGTLIFYFLIWFGDGKKPNLDFDGLGPIILCGTIFGGGLFFAISKYMQRHRSHVPTKRSVIKELVSYGWECHT